MNQNETGLRSKLFSEIGWNRFTVVKTNTNLSWYFQPIDLLWRAVCSLWRVSTNFGTLNVARTIIKEEPLSSFAQARPRFAYRYLAQHFLARNLSVKTRVEAVAHHHSKMQNLLSPLFLQEITSGQMILYARAIAGNLIEVALTLSAPDDGDTEGEWSLSLSVDGESVYLLGFTVVPGRLIGSQAQDVALISRLQGARNAYSKIKIATSALSDVAPPALLLAALQGILIALEVRDIACVKAANQTTFNTKDKERFFKSYDEFCSGLGMEENKSGFFHTSVPIREIPLSSVKRGHKIRTRKKRSTKLELTTGCSELFQKNLRWVQPKTQDIHSSGD